MLAYRCAKHMLDETLRIVESMETDCLYHFAAFVAVVFSEDYLTALMEEETGKLLLRAEKLDFPGMLGSIDCCK